MGFLKTIYNSLKPSTIIKVFGNAGDIFNPAAMKTGFSYLTPNGIKRAVNFGANQNKVGWMALNTLGLGMPEAGRTALNAAIDDGTESPPDQTGDTRDKFMAQVNNSLAVLKLAGIDTSKYEEQIKNAVKIKAEQDKLYAGDLDLVKKRVGAIGTQYVKHGGALINKALAPNTREIMEQTGNVDLDKQRAVQNAHHKILEGIGPVIPGGSTGNIDRIKDPTQHVNQVNQNQNKFKEKLAAVQRRPARRRR